MTSLFDKYLEQSNAFAGAGKPELGGLHKCFRIVLITVNIIFLIFGCVLMGVGSYAYNNHGIGAFTGATLPLGIVTLGVFIMFLSFLGCLSAWRESKIFLGFYFVFLVLMTFLLLVVGIAVYAKKNDAGSYIQSGWSAASNDVRNSLQQYFVCCGLNYWNDSTGNAWPPYDCPNWQDPVSGATVRPTNTSGEPPCAPVLTNEFYQSFNTVGTCGIVFAVLMSLCVTLVCCLIRGIQQRNMKHDITGLNPGDDSANTTVDPNTPGATASAAAGTTAMPPPVSS